MFDTKHKKIVRLSVFFCLCVIALFGTGLSEEIVLVSPHSNFKITKGSIDFTWENYIIDFGDTLTAAQYELMIWSRNRPFLRKFHYNHEPGEAVCTYFMHEIRNQIRRHGHYFWQVKATDEKGKVYHSSVRRFKIEIANRVTRTEKWTHPYSLHLQWNHRFQTAELVSFIENIQPNNHFKDFTELGFVLHQKQNFKPYLHFSEKCYLISQIGIGFDISAEFQLHQNRFIALKPYTAAKYNLFSTGVHNFSNSLFHWQAGIRWRLSPKGNVTIQTGYIPEYKIRYAQEGRELRTWTGEGYEAGVYLTVPSDFIKTFSVFGVNINLRKLPVYISYTKIHDVYSKIHLKMRRVTFLYQF